MAIPHGVGDLVDTDRFETLKLLFEIVREDGWSSARSIGRRFPDGKSAANSDLYRFQGVLFKKRGFAPTEWPMVSVDAFDRWEAEVESRLQTPQTQPTVNDSVRSAATDSKRTEEPVWEESRRLFQWIEKEWPQIDRAAADPL